MTAREWMHAAWARFRALFRRAELDRDLDQELRFHLAMREARLAQGGRPVEEARRAAALRFGNAASFKEDCREMWTFRHVETFLQDARFALRGLRKNPGFSAVAVLSLALGIAANTVMFSVVNAILLRPLPYPSAERLVRLTGFYPKGAVAALQEASRTMDVAGVGTDLEVNLTGRGEAARVGGSAVSANLFSVLGRGAAVGRTFEAGEDRPGRDRIVVLSHSLWQSRFGGDPAAIGRTLTVDGVGREVVGVMPAGFHFPGAETQLWIPQRLDPGNPEDYWGFGWMPAVARLRPGAALPQAHSELRSLVDRIGTMFPWPAPRWNADAAVVSLQADLVRDLRGKLLVLQSAVGLVLLIACANVASLLLARGAARRKEMALRSAIGASGSRLLRQLLTEGLALSLTGAALGVALAAFTFRSLSALLPADARGFAQAGIDLRVLAFVTGLSVLCGVVFGLAPALGTSRMDLAGAMKAGGQRATTAGGARLRRSFVAAEVALAVVLTVGAGLFVRTLRSLSLVDPGFRPEETLAVRVSPNPSTCLERAACVAFYEGLLHRVQELPGVAQVAAASALPLSGQEPLLPVEMEGHPLVATEAVAPLLWAGAVTPAYFQALGIRLLKGRAFDGTEGERTAPLVLVSETTARRYWPGEDPVGKRIRVVWDREWRTVVGVVGNVRQYALTGRTPKEITGAMYMPYPQAVALDRQIPKAMSLLVRSTVAFPEIAPRLRALVAGVNPDVPVSEVRAMGEVVRASVAEPRSMMWLFAGFAGCALLLAAIGTYGVVSYSAAQRTYEIGVRLALGAKRTDVFALVMAESLRLVTAGLATGLAAAFLLGRALQGFLYAVSPKDPLTFAAVAGLLLFTALLAGYFPSRRAAATNPVRALQVD